jgi:LPXTG-motif cell wall-anchored protein
MKKILAVLAALSLLGSMSMTAMAQDSNDNTDKTFTVDIPMDYIRFVCGSTHEEITESNYRTSMVVGNSYDGIISCSNGKASLKRNGYFVTGYTVNDVKPGRLVVTGLSQTYSSYNEDENINTNHGQCGGDSWSIDVMVDENGEITPTHQDTSEKSFVIVVRYPGFNVIDAEDGEIIRKDGDNKSMVSAEVTECTNGTVISVNTGCDAENSTKKFMQSITLADVKPGTLTINGTCRSYTYLTDEELDAGYTNYMGSEKYGLLFTVTGTVDENGNFTPVKDEKSKKINKTTPQTGDTTTMPAVALGLTMTAAGAVAFVYRKKKETSL